jgi:hypothetical protein
MQPDDLRNRLMPHDLALALNALILERFQNKARIGQGRSSVVWEMHDQETSVDVAFKVYWHPEHFRIEVTVMKQFNHPAHICIRAVTLLEPFAVA